LKLNNLQLEMKGIPLIILVRHMHKGGKLINKNNKWWKTLIYIIFLLDFEYNWMGWLKIYNNMMKENIILNFLKNTWKLRYVSSPCRVFSFLFLAKLCRVFLNSYWFIVNCSISDEDRFCLYEDNSYYFWVFFIRDN
jgi:hypothetical protein